jgi:hypothetical protein
MVITSVGVASPYFSADHCTRGAHYSARKELHWQMQSRCPGFLIVSGMRKSLDSGLPNDNYEVTTEMARAA